MNRLIPICPFILEADSPNQIFISYRGVADSYPLHGHDAYELELITQGRGRQWINNTPVPLKRGSMYVLTLSDVHRIEAETPLHVISIHFLPEIAQQLDIDRLESYFMQLAPEDLSLFLPLAFSVVQENGQDKPYHIQRMLSVTMLMLVHLIRNGEKQRPAETGKRLQKALKFIQDNYANPSLRLKDAADACCLSACHFSSTFHSITGCGFSEYLMSYRLHRASTLLADEKANVSEIAYEVGFSSLSHFFRVFRKAYGCTPRQYRQVAHTRLETPEGFFLDKPGWEPPIELASPLTPARMSTGA